MPGGVHVEDLQLGPDPLGGGVLAQRRLVAVDRQGELLPLRSRSMTMAWNSRSRRVGFRRGRDTAGVPRSSATNAAGAARACERSSKAPAWARRSVVGLDTAVRRMKSRTLVNGLGRASRMARISAAAMPSTSWSARRIPHPVGASGAWLHGVALLGPVRVQRKDRHALSRASSRISRRGYIPGSWVRTPARKCAG